MEVLEISQLPTEFYDKLQKLEQDPNFPNYIDSNDDRLIELRSIVELHDKDVLQKKNNDYKNELLKLATQGFSLKEIACIKHTTTSKMQNRLKNTNFMEQYHKIKKDFSAIFCFNTETEEVLKFPNKEEFIKQFHISGQKAGRIINKYKELDQYLVFNYELWQKVGV